jgi:hypothetical protein
MNSVSSALSASGAAGSPAAIAPTFLASLLPERTRALSVTLVIVFGFT